MEPGVLHLTTDRYAENIEPGLRKKFAFMGSLAPHHFVGYSSFGSRRTNLTIEGSQFFLLPTSDVWAIQVARYYWSSLTITWGLVRSRKVKVLVSQSPAELLVLLLVRRIASLRGFNVRVVAQLQGDWEDVFPRVHPSLRYFRFLWRWLMRKAIERADAVRVVSTLLEERARSLGAKTIFRFPTWTDLDSFLSRPPPAGGVSRRRHHLMCAGVLTPVKGVDVLLRAVAILQGRGLVVTVVIAGEGPLLNELQQLAESLSIADQIEWAGHLDQESLIRVLDDAVMLVHPSLSEGLPRIVMEAMARSKPVVVSDVGGIREIIDHQVEGFIVPPGNPAELAAAIGAVIRDPAGATRMGENGRTRIRTFQGTFKAAYAEMIGALIAELRDEVTGQNKEREEAG